MSIVKYSKTITNGYNPINITTGMHEIHFKPVCHWLFFSNELNTVDIFIRIDDGDPIRIPSEGFIEISEQYINKLTIEGNGDFEYVARY